MNGFLILWAVGLTIALVFTHVYYKSDADDEEEENEPIPCVIPNPVIVNELQVDENATFAQQLTAENVTVMGEMEAQSVQVQSGSTVSVGGDVTVTGNFQLNGSDLASEAFVDPLVSNQALLTQTKFLTEINFNADFKTLCQAKKFATGIGNNQFNTIYSYTGAGILRNLWLALNNANPTSTDIRVVVDGNIVWGEGAEDLSVANLFAVLNILSPFFTFQNQYNGANVQTNSSFGGYMAIDVPFQTSIEIQLKRSGNFTYWLQPQLQLIPTSIMTLLPYKCYIKTFRYNSCVFDSEYPLLNEQGNGNGVYLCGIKCFFNSFSAGTYESRLRVYKSDNGFGDAIVTPATGFSGPDLNTPDVFAGAVNGQVVYVTADFYSLFLNSNGFTGGLPPFGNYADDSVAVLTGTIPNGVSTFVPFQPQRFMFQGDVISVPGDSYLSLTFPCGDPKVGMSGSAQIIGQCYYYK